MHLVKIFSNEHTYYGILLDQTWWDDYVYLAFGVIHSNPSTMHEKHVIPDNISSNSKLWNLYLVQYYVCILHI